MRMNRRSVLVVVSLPVPVALAASPNGYPSSYGRLVSAAHDEGRVAVYSTTDLPVAGALIRDFEQLYPGIRVDYSELNSGELHQRFLTEHGREPDAPGAAGPAAATHQPFADLKARLKGKDPA